MAEDETPNNVPQTTERAVLRARVCLVPAALLALWIAAGGCKREPAKRLSAAQIHQITQELGKAAADAAPGSVIKTRRARGASAGTGGDELYVGLHGGDAAARLHQSINRVAGNYGLTVDPETRSGNTVKFALRSHGSITERIEIEQLATTPKSAPGTARLAILLDDLGSDRATAEAIFALHAPITISVLPYHANSQAIAAAAHQHGCAVMLHLPMQSVGNESPEQQELKPGLSGDQVRTLVEKMLDAVPQADGVNNHQGSQATADAALMSELMRVLKDDGVFYVDSRTTPETVAYDTARREGVKTAFRNVPFLDDVQYKNAVKQQLRIAIQGAKQKGEAIAIGHAHVATLEALRETLPLAKTEGVQLVFVSELVR